jgi:type IV pilus assembly protein PilX
MSSLATLRRGRRRAITLQQRGQRGLVLLVVMVVLGLMFLAGLGVMRAADTGNVISGNFAFQQAAVQASDRAITDALTVVANRATGGNGNTAVANQYLNVRSTTLDSRGILCGSSCTSTAIATPAQISSVWDTVPCVTERGVLIANCALDAGNYRVQYMVERMCSSNPTFTDINDIRAKCEYEASASALSASSIGVRYRVLIRVRGPRGTESWFEAMLSGPAST